VTLVREIAERRDVTSFHFVQRAPEGPRETS
jgi:hypothetical protein